MFYSIINLNNRDNILCLLYILIKYTMELAIPIIAMGGLYMISRQDNNNRQNEPEEEGFVGYRDLPNTNLPNENFPSERPMETPELSNTERLTHNNHYEGDAYTDKYFGKKGLAVESNPATNTQQFTSLAGESVNNDYFQHNNMVPFFGRKKNTPNFDANQNEGIMDNYLGKGSQHIEKKEQAPLFAPNENYQWAYGTPNQSDFIQSRVNTVNKMANVLPFEQETVAPGIGLGYGTEGSNGFNSGMMNREAWMPKTVDELRVDTNKKACGVELFGLEGPAMSAIKEMGTIGKMERNRPNRHFEMGKERLMTTTGVEKGVTLRPIQEDRYTNRPETTVSYTGVASSDNKGTFVDGEYMPSKHIDLGSVPLSIPYAGGKGGATDGDYGVKSQVSYENNRSANQQTDYFGAIGGAIGAVVSPILDILRPSRKENTVGTLRPYQNAGSTVPQTYIFNPADRPGTTIRETTENSKYHMNSGNSTMNKGGYTVAKVQPISNNRMNQSDFFYAGNASAGEGTLEPRPYDAEYRQRNNDVKSSTIKGRMVPGNMAMLNHDVTVKSRDKTGQLTNNRAPIPVSAQSTPGLETMGRLQGKQKFESGRENNRNGSEILDSLKKNPYALSIH
jgi:hypothetical protein